jgi:hypothetical protein
MSRKIFGEFLEFFLKGLNPFKIQTNFKYVFIPDFEFKFCWEFELLPKRKVATFEFIFWYAKVRMF